VRGREVNARPYRDCGTGEWATTPPYADLLVFVGLARLL
jgi:hypothetical protein